MGFPEARIAVDDQYRKISVVIDDELIQANIERVVPALEHIVGLLLRKADQPPHVVDVNFYRKERERLIVKLARAAAHKARLTKEDVELPPMNGYERRIVHVEIAAHPELRTESEGIGKERKVIIKHI